MTPTSFEFKITMARDARLARAVRDLAVQAAGYAQLGADAGQGLAGHVARATEAAVAAAPDARALIDLQFSGGEHEIEVVISCEAAASATVPASMANGSITVAWTRDGTRHTCRIRQQTAA